MSQPQHSDTKTPSKAGEKAAQDSQQRRNAHTNSASAGREGDIRGGQHSSTKNLETEPDRDRVQK